MRRESIQNEYMFDTKVENIFINEYMISAPGNFVKVYLVALMYADLNKDLDNETLARILGTTVDEVQRAWKYWMDLGLVKMYKGEIVFVQMKEVVYGKKVERKETREAAQEAALHILDNEEVKNMFEEISRVLRRPLSGKETDAILSWMEVIGATPEVIVFAYTYCVARKKEAVNYIAKVVEGWTGRGFATVAQVEKFLEETDQRHYVYKRIMKALGFPRPATEEERRIIDTWVDEYNLSMDAILAACNKTSGIGNPNINYVNAVLTSDKKPKTGKDENGQVTRKHVMDYYEYIREKAESDAAERRSQILEMLPVIGQLEEKIKNKYMEITRLAVTGGADKMEKLNAVKSDIENYRKEIGRILNKNGVPEDYMDVRYKCPLCQDTGANEDGQPCSCYIERSKEAADWVR